MGLASFNRMRRNKVKESDKVEVKAETKEEKKTRAKKSEDNQAE